MKKNKNFSPKTSFCGTFTNIRTEHWLGWMFDCGLDWVLGVGLDVGRGIRKHEIKIEKKEQAIKKTYEIPHLQQQYALVYLCLPTSVQFEERTP